jgi:hypothetical protein
VKTRNVRAWEIPVVRRFARWMAKREWGAFTCPLPWITLLIFWKPYSLVTWRHEMVHAEQAERLGWWGWWKTYVVWFVRLYRLRRGQGFFRAAAAQLAYIEHPLEVEAYAGEGNRESVAD